MNRAEKEQYLVEYEQLKKQGKPFFPYAVMKDSTMALIVVLVIVVLSLVLGAEQGPKADPTTTTYTPRPDWYFFFLFEVLRVLKPPYLVPLATIGIPTIAMILLFLLPFYDRGPERRPERRPVAMTAMSLTIVVDGLPDLQGRQRWAADNGGFESATSIRGGEARGRAIGLPGVPQDRRQRQRHPGARPDAHRVAHPARGDPPLAGGGPEHHALLQEPGARRSSTRSPTSSPI